MLKGSLKPGVLFGYSKKREYETMALVFTKSIKNELRIYRRYGRSVNSAKGMLEIELVYKCLFFYTKLPQIKKTLT